MDSFHYNQSYDQWNSPYSPHHPPPAPLLLPLLPPPRQSHPDSPNFYLPSTHNSGQRKDGHHYSHRQYFSPNPAVNQSSSYYLQHPPPPHQHHPPLLPPQQHQPYIPQQSPWAGYKDKRVDSWTDAGPGRMYTSGRRLDPSPSHDYQYDYSRSSRDSSGVSINRGLDGSFRSRDEFRNTGYVRKESRIEGSYQDRGQLKTKSDRCFRGLGECNRNLASRVGYGTDLYGVTVSRDMGRPYASHEGTRNQRWNEGKILYPRKKDDYYHSETEQYFDRGRREESSELNRTPRKQMLKKSALLRRETTRNHQKGRENGRNHSNYNGKRFNSNLFRGKEHLGHSDRGLVEKQRERTPVDLDVSFELNLPVAKPIASPTGAGIHPSRSVTPRSFKARRALVPDKSENPSVTEGNGKLRTQFSDEASVSEGSRPSKKQSISSEIEKKPVKITDEGPEALTREVIITVDAAEKNSSVCEALKEAKDDSDVEHDSNMGVCSIIEDVIERGKSILNSQDVLNRTGCNAGEALPPKVMEMEDIVKESTNRSPTKLLLSVSTAADLSEYSEAVVRFAHYVDKVLEKSSRDASIYFNKEDPGHQATKLDTCGIEDGSNGINKNVNSLSPENDCCRGLIFSASLEIPSVSMELANANNNISGDLANAHSFTIGTYPSTIVDSPDMNESKNFTHCEDTANPSVENGSIKESMETKPLRSVAEMADNLESESDEGIQTCVKGTSSSHSKVDVKGSLVVLPVERTDGYSRSYESDLDIAVPSEEGMESLSAERLAPVDNLESESDEGIQTCVKGTSSSHSKVDVKGSLVVLPVERTDGYSRSYESDLDIAVPSEEGMESLSAERLAPVEDLGLTSNQPSEIPSVDKLSGSNNRNLKTCLPEPNVSLNKDITYGSSEGLVQRDVSQNAFTFVVIYLARLHWQPCSPVGKFLPEDQGGCRSSGAFGSVWNFAVKKNLEVDLSRLIGQSFGQILSETHVAAKVDETYNVKQKSKHYGGTNEPIQSETHVASMVDDSNNYNEKAKPSGGTTKYRTLEIDVNSDVGGLEKYSRNIIKNDIFDGEALSADGKVVGTEILGNSGVHLSSRADVKFALTHVNDHVKYVPDRNPQNKTSLSSRKMLTLPISITIGIESLVMLPLLLLLPLSSTFSTEQNFPIVTVQSCNSYLNRIENKSTGSASKVAVGKCALSYSMNYFTTGLPESHVQNYNVGQLPLISSGLVISDHPLMAAPRPTGGQDLFDTYFRRADLDGDGRISGAEAVGFFQGSNLPKPVLAQKCDVILSNLFSSGWLRDLSLHSEARTPVYVWSYADAKKAGYLGRAEFYNALKLVTVAQSRRELTPEIVKAAIYSPASANIPAPKINLAATPSPQPRGPVAQTPGVTSVAAGMRGPQMGGNVSTSNQQVVPGQQNQFTGPPPSQPPQNFQSQGMPPGGTIAPRTANQPVPSNWISGRSVGPSGQVNLQIPSSQRGYGLTAPNSIANNIPQPHMTPAVISSTTTRPQVPVPASAPLDAPSNQLVAKELAASGNGFPSDSIFGDVFSVASTQPKQHTTGTTSTMGISSVSTGTVVAPEVAQSVARQSSIPQRGSLNRIENKSTGSASKVAVGDDSFLVKAGEIPTLEKQSKPPSDSSTSKVSNAIDAPSGKCALSYSMDHPTTGLPESIMDSATSGEASVPHSGGDTSKTSDIPIQTDYASNCQQKKIPPNLDSSDLKRTVYVKRKANQLVAASDIHSKSRSQFSTSDGYFKRNKNQLVRTSESRVNHSPDDALDSRASATMVSERSSSSAFSDAAVTRPYKRSKFSLVWTQNDQQSDLPSSHMRYRRILPQLVPWKRVTYWRRLMNSVSALRNGSFSNISQKLSTMRKRHTVYTRSTNGYSLRKSKVLSIGGSHLKWSKSIERDSRKANEEATLAVAAFSKKENEKHSGQSSTRKTSRNHLARGRIFRFGSLRYKMDPSRRTLQRISDVDSPCSGPTENGKGAKRPFIPKRLVIGHEEYVRVGNGNQLVRDPKKRTRALANEKVRWSLHNVRLRLAKKKKKYCQFFTRFGKCNKDDGKCPYVHDPSKIAVCTKFLNGLCANDNCKLTHKVIPERMPDCSYFLQGLCNNEACPYRHVHVNPSAAICDGFLKGYCSDGNECRKKHSYTCPDFEATGSCPQGSKCKLHHPKSQGKGRKRKRPSEPLEKNARGRYFGSLQKLFSESEPMVVDRHPTESEDFGKEGFEFISLGATEEEAGENNDQATEQSISSESEEPASIYELIKPVALMR
ncbi:hypothetical protein IGI04_022835 [Brassica rapa subsp. trilocularis]|uniref:EF-hand domain-containing protein n=1 Tax=Brassica rapa subsp. trilocularis TaxID=1813537 RepID=A0ABQ7M243_BRACM|nr:hypothetical protein IGI04_022835 [Brassica rapa subsp. trilocularis]